MPYPAFQSAILYSSDAGRAGFKGLSLRAGEALFGRSVLPRQLPALENHDNGSGEIEANDTAFAWDFDADEGPARVRPASSSRDSAVGYELPFGTGKRWLSGGGPSRYLLGGWQVQGIVRLGCGFPFTVTSTNVCQCGSFVPQRVNFAPGREGDAGKPRQSHVKALVRSNGLRGASAGNAGDRGSEHRARARDASGSTSR